MKEELEYTPYEEYYPAPNGVSSLERTENILLLARENAENINKALDVASQITDVYAESQRLNAQVAIVQEMSKVEMAKVAAKYMATKDVIEKTFAERHGALSQHYKALDHALENGDRELILAAMHQISAIVTTSPLNDIQEFVKRFNDTSTPLLDF